MIRWAVPALAVAAVGVAAIAPQAIADPAPPPKTAEQLLVDVQNARVEAFAGTVETRSDLGLPALPTADGSDFAALTSGTHTLRVWHAGDDKTRVSLLADGSEASVIRNGDDLWQWSSEQRTAKHAVVPDSHGASEQHPERPAGPEVPRTPQEAAEQILANIEPTTAVTVSQTTRVADRAAYELVLDPKSTETLVGRITMAVDAETHAPLRVEVWSSGADKPALQVGFTDVEFSAPDDSVFNFTPPAGVTVEQVDPSDRKPAAEKPAEHADMPEPTVVGDGWDKVTITTMPAMPEKAEQTESTAEPRRHGRGGEPADFKELIDQLPTVQGPWGTGKVLTSSLFTMVITDDGRVAVGMVPTERVVAAIPQ